MKMKHFTEENTQGFSKEEIEELNELLYSDELLNVEFNTSEEIGSDLLNDF